MDAAHPLGVAPGEVVVDGDEVHALATETVEVHRERRHEGLALAGLHLGDPSEVERGAAHHLDVVVTLADDPVGRFADDRERLGKEVVEGAPLAIRSRNSTVLARSASSSRRRISASSALISGTMPWRAFSFLPSPRGGCDRECSCGRPAYRGYGRWSIGCRPSVTFSDNRFRPIRRTWSGWSTRSTRASTQRYRRGRRASPCCATPTARSHGSAIPCGVSWPLAG